MTISFKNRGKDSKRSYKPSQNNLKKGRTRFTPFIIRWKRNKKIFGKLDNLLTFASLLNKASVCLMV